MQLMKNWGIHYFHSSSLRQAMYIQTHRLQQPIDFHPTQHISMHHPTVTMAL
jgi:arylamine N-acetyltransferase